MDGSPIAAIEPRPRVLVVGPRRGLCDALRRHRVDFAVWSDPARRVNRAQFVHGAPLFQSRTRAREEATGLLERHGTFTHVVAGTEAGVLPAAVARRVLGARQSSHTTVLRCRDKLLMKRHLAEHGVPMTAFLEAESDQPPQKLREALGGKIVVKDRTSSGGRGIVVAEDLSALEAARGRGRLAERYVDAPEISVESFVARRAIRFQNVTEYVRKGSVNLLPGALDSTTGDAVMALNRHVIESLRIEWGITHLELYLTRDGPLFGEIALRPPGGYIMELIEIAWGFSAWDAFLAVELDAATAFPSAPERIALASILHPGPGRVTRLDGADAVRADPRVVELRLKVAVGDAVGERVGVGSDVGYALLAGKDRDAALEALRFVDEALRISVGPEPGGRS